MAFKEGKCINCGSIIFVDPQKDKTHCMFCDCVFDSKLAFEALAHPENFEFKNEKQPKYEGELNLPQYGNRPLMQPQQIKTQSSTTAERPYEIKVKNIPDLKMPQKPKLIILGSTVLLLIMVLAIMIPTILKRNGENNRVHDAYMQSLPYKVKDQYLFVSSLGSTDVVLALPQKVTKPELEKLVMQYANTRADVLNISKTDEKALLHDLKFKLITPHGGYLVVSPNSKTEITTAALTELK